MSNIKHYEESIACDDDGCINNTEGHYWCTMRTNEDAWMGKFMIMSVLLYYIAKVVPDQFSVFIQSMIDSDGPLQRLSKIRKAVFDKDEDSIMMRGK